MAKNSPQYVYGIGDNQILLPPSPIIAQRAPTVTDRMEIGTTWIDQPNDDAYMLTSITAGSATWINVGGGAGIFTTVTASGNITTSAGNVVITAGNLTMSALGFGACTTNATGVVTSINGTDGQLMIAATGLAPAWATLASGDGSITITPGVNTLDVRTAGALASTFPTDAGVATPVMGATTVAGGLNINTAGAGGTVTVNLDASPTVAGSLTAGVDMTMTSGVFTVTGTTNAAQTIYLRENAGAAATIDIHSDQSTLANSINIHSDVGGVTIAGTAGPVAITSGGAAGEDITLQATSSINLISTEAAAECIYLHENAGVLGSIRIHADQGTDPASVLIDSDDGGITLLSTALISDDAINLTAVAGGIDIDGAMQVNIASSENTADSIVITSSAGGIDILANGAAAGEDIDIQASSSINLLSTENIADCIYIQENAGVGGMIRVHANQGSDPASIHLESDDGGITLTSTALASDDAINIAAVAGGVDIDAAMQINITSTENTVDSIVIQSTLGGIDILANGAAATEDIDIQASSSINLLSTENVADCIYIQENAGAGGMIRVHANQGSDPASIHLESDDGGITLTSTALASDDAINIAAVAGGIDIDAAMQINITSTENTVDSIVIQSTLGGIDILANGAAATEDIDIQASSSINLLSTENAAQAIFVQTNGGVLETIDIYANQGTDPASINIHSDDGGITLDSGLASADAININTSNAAGGIDIDAGTNGIIVATTGPITLGAAAASNFIATGAFDLTLQSTAGSVIATAGQAVADAIQLTASDAAGGITMATGTGGITMGSTNGIVAITSGTAAINVGTDATAHTVTIGNAIGASAVAINSGTGDITLTSTDDIACVASGNLSLNTNGDVTMTPVVATVAGVTIVNNGRVTQSTFTGQVTAAAAAQVFTITNASVTATNALFVTATNQGANDAQMTIYRIEQLAGSLEVTLYNNGAAALNGNVNITVWCMN